MGMSRDQLVASGVAAAAFACSATHIYSVAVEAGNWEFIAAIHPIGLDGLIYVGIRGINAGKRWAGWLATVYGVGMSLAFNAVSYTDNGHMPPFLMAIAMPLALVLAVLVVGHGTPDKQDTAPVPVPVPPAAAPVVPDTIRAEVVQDRPVAVPAVPAVPVSIVPDKPKAIAARKVSTKVSHDVLRADVQAGLSSGLSLPEAKAKVAANHGVSTKTVQRALAATADAA